MSDKYGVRPSDLPNAPKTAADEKEEPLKEAEEVAEAFETTDKAK